MYVDDCSCCALNEIAEIGQDSNPEDTLKKLCKQSGWDLEQLGAFYIFTGVVRVAEPRKNEDEESDDYEDLTSGPALAKYIRENKLGNLKETVGRRNRVNHPLHTVKVWIWAPSLRNMLEWWKTRRPEKPRNKYGVDW